MHHQERPDDAPAEKSVETAVPEYSDSSGIHKNENEIEYPGTLKLWVIVFTLCLSLFLCGLDQTVITTAVPAITDDFHALEDIGWYTSAYLVTTATLTLAYGRLYTFFSIKIIFLIALFIFEVGSIVCATAQSSYALIIGRAVAGAGASGIFPGCSLILMCSAPLQKRPLYLGIITAMFGIASIAGPYIGGAFTDRASWRWCFWINLPLGGLTVLIIALFVKTPVNAAFRESTTLEKVKKLDLPGLVLVIASLICLILALQWGGAIYPWNDGRVVALLVVFAVLFLAFIGSQYFLPNSRTLPNVVLRSRSIWFAFLFAAFISGSMFVVITYVPIYFQAIKGVSALGSGSRVTPTILGFLVFTIISGVVTTITGYYNPSMIMASILSSVGSGLLTTLVVNTGSPKWIGYQALYGFGIGFGLQQPLLVAQTVLPEADVPSGVALINLAQMLGGAVFVAVSQNVFQNKLEQDIRGLVPNFDTSRIFTMGARDFFALFQPDELSQVLPLYCKAITTTFYISTAICAASIIGALGTEWTSTKKKTTENAGGEITQKLEG
ncbi:putative efflux pump antibiotic resistance protein [Massariosphaeria phaeospora]|uniref:Putative efflux pump antibiotic resistance protein n=1 Tax=Massariosphaeria phaeospora TaxID=100035 RepID=A0A7C8I354_9PLEO|nr:putative efflux pump antibiotic resistance protein [Massariosphaeria phaeospora]